MRDMDEDMGKAARAVQTAASAYGSAGKRLYESQRFRALRGKLPERVLELGTKQVHNAGEYSVTNSSKVLSERELAQASADSGQVPSLGMANGSRKSAFIRERGGIGAKPPHPPILATQFNSVVAFNPDGTGHFGRSKHVPVETGNNQAWADDEGYSVGTINSASACPWPTGGTASAYVKSSAKEFPSYHRFSPGDKHKGNRDEMHDLASCKDAQGNPCNSVWVGRQEFNINNSDAQQLRPDASGQAAAGGAPEQWRQPKSVVGIERDYSARSRRDPWEFQFNLSVSNGSTTELDLKKDRFGGARDTQRTLSTGITYYHRHMSNAGQSWLEPPNLYNPYWRATLVPADIDGDRDLTVVGRDLILRLKQSGFKGVQ
jgi:hypothetical protein